MVFDCRGFEGKLADAVSRVESGGVYGASLTIRW